MSVMTCNEVCYWCQQRAKSGKHGLFCKECYTPVHRLCVGEIGISARDYGVLIEFASMGLSVISESGYKQLALLDRKRPIMEYTAQ